MRAAARSPVRPRGAAAAPRRCRGPVPPPGRRGRPPTAAGATLAGAEGRRGREPEPPAGLPELEAGRRLAKECTWGIGGPAALFAEARTAAELAALLRHARAHRLRWMVLGKGSNCLFDDRGFRGLVIQNRIGLGAAAPAAVEEEEGAEGGDRLLTVGSGYPFNVLAGETAKRGLGGLEWGVGIPGTVGGAVAMNAGAHGCATGDVLEAVEYVVADGDCDGGRGGVHRLARGDPGWEAFGYRSSPFQGPSSPGWAGRAVVTAATFRLAPSPTARADARRHLAARNATQPVRARSVGCVFRNPAPGPAVDAGVATAGLERELEGGSPARAGPGAREARTAGQLIDGAGLKGLAVGGAEVSRVHANYLVNASGQASSRDMAALLAEVQRAVEARTGVRLQAECILVPYAAGEGEEDSEGAAEVGGGSL